MENFLQMLEATEKNTGKIGSKITKAVMRAKAFVAFERGRYRELYNIIETREFAQKYHPQLQDMWYRAHYKEAEGVRGRALGKNFFFIGFFLELYLLLFDENFKKLQKLISKVLSPLQRSRRSQGTCIR